MSDSPSFQDAIRDLPGAGDQLWDLLEHAPFGVYVDNPIKGCTYASPTLLAQFGIGWDDFRGFGWARFVEEEDALRLRERIRVYESELEPIHVSYRVRGQDNGLRWIHARVEPVLGPGRRHLGSIGITVDQTKEREFQDRAAQSQKMEAIGRLSSRLAHDFNNLLTPMLFAAEQMENRTVTEDDRFAVAAIFQGIDQARQLTGQLLTLSRHKVSAVQCCDLDQEVTKLEPLLRRTLGEGIDLRLRLDAPGGLVPLDRGKVGQILVNLAVNGLDAMQGYGQIRITSSLRDGRVRLEVEDDGVGMDEALLGCIFEPFFTTKAVGHGTGLGLSTVQDLVTLAGGSIEVRSELGKGSSFHIDLPQVEKSPSEGQQPSTVVRDLSKARGIRVLLVEDQDALRQSLAYSLALEGIEVHGARSLAEARAALEKHGVPDLLICDVMLPDGTSVEWVADLRVRSPELPVLFLSGYADSSALRPVLDQDRTSFQEKPFGASQLLNRIAELLAGTAHGSSDL